jgi:hypothetical protein
VTLAFRLGSLCASEVADAGSAALFFLLGGPFVMSNKDDGKIAGGRSSLSREFFSAKRL